MVRRFLPLLLAFLVMGYIAWWSRPDRSAEALRVTLELRSAHAGEWEIYYDADRSTYDQAHSLSASVSASSEVQTIDLQLPSHVGQLQGLRIDPGQEAVETRLIGLTFHGPYRAERLDADALVGLFSAVNDLKALSVDSLNDELILLATGPDPYLASTASLLTITHKVMTDERPWWHGLLLAFCAGSFTFLLTRWILRRWAPKVATIRGSDKPRPRVLLAAGGLATVAGLLTYGLVNNIDLVDRALVLELELKTSSDDHFQVFHAEKPGSFTEDRYTGVPVKGSDQWQLASFELPKDNPFRYLRLDFGNHQDSVTVRRITLRCNDRSITYDATAVSDLFHPNTDVSQYDLRADGLHLVFSGDDPFLHCDEDMGTRLRQLQAQAGNGPIPWIAGLMIGMMVFAGSYADPRLQVLLAQGRTVEWCTTLVFCGLLTMPILGEWLPIQPVLTDTEKRPLADKPQLLAHDLLDFPSRYMRYYGDHFAYRKMLFRWNSLFHHHVLHTSSMPDNVVYGKDDFLFLIRPGVKDYYRGIPLFTEQELAEIAERLDQRRAWLAAKGIDYYLFVPPMKATIYRDKRPDALAQVLPTTGMDQLKAYLEEHCSVKMIDPREQLLAGREVRDTYYSSDIHWNPWGALIGYQVLMERLLQDHPELTAPCQASDYIVEVDTNDQGDLALQLALNDQLTRITYMMVPYQPTRYREQPERALPASAFFKYRPIFTQGPDPRAPKLLMFRDSFSVYLIPYLGDHFREAVYVWSPLFIPDIVEQEKPDIVVQEIMELFLPDLLHDKVRENI